MKKRKEEKTQRRRLFSFWRFWRKSDECLKKRSDSPTYQSYQDLLLTDEIDCRVPPSSSQKTSHHAQPVKSGEAFESSAELRKCLARAQMEAELDNALRQLEAETRKCVKRRLARQEAQMLSHPRLTEQVSTKESQSMMMGPNSPEGSISFYSSCSASFDKNETEPSRNSLGFCGYSQSSSADSAISTSHSQSELGSSRQEYRLSFIYLKTMATLNETLVCNDEMDEALDTYEESLNLSEYSSGQSTFDSDCESDYDLPGPPLRIDESPDLNTTVTESFASSENFNTIRAANTSVDSFLKISDDKYKQSDYHYDNLNVSSRTASFKKSMSFDVPDGQLKKTAKPNAPSFESLRRRCLSAPNLKLMNNCFKCENCSALKSAIAGLLYDCSELNGLLKGLLRAIPSSQINLDDLNTLGQAVTKKETEIANIMKLVHLK